MNAIGRKTILGQEKSENKTCSTCLTLCQKVIKYLKRKNTAKPLVCPVCSSKECMWYLGCGLCGEPRKECYCKNGHRWIV